MELSPTNKSLVVQLKSIGECFESDEDKIVKAAGYILTFVACAMDKAPRDIAETALFHVAKFVVAVEDGIKESVKIMESIKGLMGGMEGGCDACPGYGHTCGGDKEGCKDAG